jgi:hypothetical protein
LPDGKIIFSSNRQLRSKALLLDEGKPAFEAFDEDNNEPAFALHVIEADGNGLEQGFTIASPPAGVTDQLVLTLDITGDLAARELSLAIRFASEMM